jgi:hypothetical protein
MLPALQVWLTSVFNEGHFTLEVETLFLPNIASYFSQVTETSNTAMPTHAVQTVQVLFKSVGKNGTLL